MNSFVFKQSLMYRKESEFTSKIFQDRKLCAPIELMLNCSTKQSNDDKNNENKISCIKFEQDELIASNLQKIEDIKKTKAKSINNNLKIYKYDGNKFIDREIRDDDGLFGQFCYQKQIKFLICITMYNENRTSFQETLIGIYNNLENLKQNNNIEKEQFAIIVVIDGIETMHPTMVEYCCQQEKYNTFITSQQTLLKRKEIYISGNPAYPKNSAIVYPIQFQNNKEKIVKPDDYINVFLAIKLQNKGFKLIYSYSFEGKGFCEMLNPKYSFLIDCGTIPGNDSLSKFITAFDNDKQIGGLCGSLSLYLQPYYRVDKVRRQIVRTDQEQYKEYG